MATLSRTRRPGVAKSRRSRVNFHFQVINHFQTLSALFCLPRSSAPTNATSAIVERLSFIFENYFPKTRIKIKIRQFYHAAFECTGRNLSGRKNKQFNNWLCLNTAKIWNYKEQISQTEVEQNLSTNRMFWQLKK